MFWSSPVYEQVNEEDHGDEVDDDDDDDDIDDDVHKELPNRNRKPLPKWALLMNCQCTC